jgi:hypothetical protein
MLERVIIGEIVLQGGGVVEVDETCRCSDVVSSLVVESSCREFL